MLQYSFEFQRINLHNLIKMKAAQISEFSLSPLQFQNPPSKVITPSTYEKQLSCSDNQNTQQFRESSSKKYECETCSTYLSEMTDVKKREIVLEYEMEILKEKMIKVERENEYLKQKQYEHHTLNLEKYNPIFYFKEDLEAELKETQALLEMQILCKSQERKLMSKQRSLKQYPKEQLSKAKNDPSQICYKKKCEELLFENVKLQQQHMVQQKIIEQRQLFPLYHYDSRILNLRKNVEYWYRVAEQRTTELNENVQKIKSIQSKLLSEFQTKLKEESNHWERTLKKIQSQIQSSSKSCRLEKQFEEQENSLSGQQSQHHQETILKNGVFFIGSQKKTKQRELKVSFNTAKNSTHKGQSKKNDQVELDNSVQAKFEKISLKQSKISSNKDPRKNKSAKAPSQKQRQVKSSTCLGSKRKSEVPESMNVSTNRNKNNCNNPSRSHEKRERSSCERCVNRGIVN